MFLAATLLVLVFYATAIFIRYVILKRWLHR
jgi:hypothetical protein